VLAVWAKGGLAERFGDPLAIWRGWADRVSGRALDAGHFLMEEAPQELTTILRPFLSDHL
jgi:haloacetate dehalogenase